MRLESPTAMALDPVSGPCSPSVNSQLPLHVCWLPYLLGEMLRLPHSLRGACRPGRKQLRTLRISSASFQLSGPRFPVITLRHRRQGPLLGTAVIGGRL